MTTTDAEDNVIYHTVYIDPRPLADVFKELELGNADITGPGLHNADGSNNDGSDESND